MAGRHEEIEIIDSTLGTTATESGIANSTLASPHALLEDSSQFGSVPTKERQESFTPVAVNKVSNQSISKLLYPRATKMRKNTIATKKPLLKTTKRLAQPTVQKQMNELPAKTNERNSASNIPYGANNVNNKVQSDTVLSHFNSLNIQSVPNMNISKNPVRNSTFMPPASSSVYESRPNALGSQPLNIPTSQNYIPYAATQRLASSGVNIQYSSGGVPLNGVKESSGNLFTAANKQHTIQNPSQIIPNPNINNPLQNSS